MRFIVHVLFFILSGMTLMSCAGTGGSIAPLTREECANMQKNRVITPANPVPCERLRRVNFHYVNFENAIAIGNVVVLDAVADQTKGIFSALFKQRFPIHQAVVMENYQGNDEAAMADNNTSAFNGRSITGGNSWSKHAYGVAIDINPLQNPYIALSNNGSANILPPASAQSFVNRRTIRPDKKARLGMVESVVEIFTRHGFMTWGGEWDFPIDYQHFEIGTQGFVDDLVSQTPDIARQIFNRYMQSYRDCAANSSETDPVKRRVVCVEKVRK